MVILASNPTQIAPKTAKATPAVELEKSPEDPKDSLELSDRETLATGIGGVGLGMGGMLVGGSIGWEYGLDLIRNAAYGHPAAKGLALIFGGVPLGLRYGAMGAAAGVVAGCVVGVGVGMGVAHWMDKNDARKS